MYSVEWLSLSVSTVTITNIHYASIIHAKNAIPTQCCSSTSGFVSNPLQFHTGIYRGQQSATSGSNVKERARQSGVKNRNWEKGVSQCLATLREWWQRGKLRKYNNSEVNMPRHFHAWQTLQHLTNVCKLVKSMLDIEQFPTSQYKYNGIFKSRTQQLLPQMLNYSETIY